MIISKVTKKVLKFYGLKENPHGIPSQWYGNIVGGHYFFDGFGFIVKQAELMVDLKKIGIKRSKYGPHQKDMLEAMQKLYLP